MSWQHACRVYLQVLHCTEAAIVVSVHTDISSFCSVCESCDRDGKQCMLPEVVNITVCREIEAGPKRPLCMMAVLNLTSGKHTHEKKLA